MLCMGNGRVADERLIDVLRREMNNELKIHHMSANKLVFCDSSELLAMPIRFRSNRKRASAIHLLIQLRLSSQKCRVIETRNECRVKR